MKAVTKKFASRFGLVLLSLCIASGVLACKEWYWIAPPSDYFVPLLKKELDLDLGPQTVEFEFENKYEGSYGLYFGADFPFPSGMYMNDIKPLELTGHLRVFSGDELFFEHLIDDTSGYFRGNGEAGELIMRYYVPEDLPRKQSLRGVLVLQSGRSDLKLKTLMGPQFVSISKGADK